MRKIAISLSAIAALATAMAVTPASARDGRNGAAIGLGIAGAAIGAGIAASNGYGYGYGPGYAPGYAYGPRYYDSYNYYGGPRYPRRAWRHRHHW